MEFHALHQDIQTEPLLPGNVAQMSVDSVRQILTRVADRDLDRDKVIKRLERFGHVLEI